MFDRSELATRRGGVGSLQDFNRHWAKRESALYGAVLLQHRVLNDIAECLLNRYPQGCSRSFQPTTQSVFESALFRSRSSQTAILMSPLCLPLSLFVTRSSVPI